MLASDRSWQGVVWVWHVNPPLPIPSWNGDAESLEVAKIKFNATWEQFYASLTPQKIEIAAHHLKVCTLSIQILGSRQW
jgi:hypothetical protein